MLLTLVEGSDVFVEFAPKCASDTLLRIDAAFHFGAGNEPIFDPLLVGLHLTRRFSERASTRPMRSRMES
ncbi:hypothetical protein ACFZ8E_19805 [Methylobacterium sp. HMF5984]|uniref:hypothetical protein n=1 Tax=Methylobacterium sp. HMF5984 TaxID=3367370 RepID=UPI003855392A